jgi:hypothetical protein
MSKAYDMVSSVARSNFDEVPSRAIEDLVARLQPSPTTLEAKI